MLLPPDPILNVMIFIAALAVLAKASHIVIKSSISLAKHLEIGEFAVGFIFIAVVTSLPELMISVIAGLSGHGEIIIGNVIGSNIANKLLIFGMVAIFQGIVVSQKELIDHAGILLGVSLIPLILLWIGYIDFFSGLVLMGVFVIYAIIVPKTKISLEIKKLPPTGITVAQAAYQVLKDHISALVDMVYLLVAIGFVILASQAVVETTTNVGLLLGVGKSFIGLTAIAIGTSLPEIAIAATAIREKHISLALGEVLGTSVVNLTLVLGMGAMFTTIPMGWASIGPAVLFMVLVHGVTLFLLCTRKRIGRVWGIVYLAGYALFLFFLTHYELFHTI